MYAYHATKLAFIADVATGHIGDLILAGYKENFGRETGGTEVKAWQESLAHLAVVLDDSTITPDLEIVIEYKLAPTGKRADVLLLGKNVAGVGQVIVVELKQWAAAEITNKDGVIKAVVGANWRELAHPSYQANSYATLLGHFNQAVYENKVTVSACAWLHNYQDDGVITDPVYAAYVQQAPVFLQGKTGKFRDFIAQRITQGAPGLLALIENSAVKPSPSVAENLPAALLGRDEFIMLDEQKVV